MKNRIVKQLLGISVATVLFAQMPMLAFAFDYDISKGNITITATADDVHTVTYYESEGGEEKTRENDTDPVVTGSTTANEVIIKADGGDAYVKFDNATIDMSNNEYTIAVKVMGDNVQNDVHIELEESNILKGGKQRAGLQDELAGELIITDVDNNGSLTVTGGSKAAAIGGGINAAGTNITISGGTINATGGDDAAAIGGGKNANGTDITISGGTVTATGGLNAAAIGGGINAAGTNIKISGGEVTATGGLNAAAIGGGTEGAGTDITISGGTVTATGASNAAAIGGGINAAGTDITISGGTVTATGGSSAAAIGGGINRAGTNIKISGGEVTATGGDDAAAIGGGDEGAGTNITISGNAKVTATGGECAAAIGGGKSGAGTNITISGGEVTATGGQWGSGIGSGLEGTASGITISGGEVTAVGGKYFPGIGGMQCTDDVIISGSATVNAAGGAGDSYYGAGAAIGTAADGSNSGNIVNGTEKLNSADLYNTGSINTYPAGTTIAQMSTTQPTTTYIGTIEDPNPVIPPNPSGQIDKVTVNDNNNNAGDPNNNVTSDTAPVDEAHAFVASTDAKLQEHINKILALINSGKIAEANALIANGILLDTGRWYTFNKDTCALIEKASQLGIKVTLHYEYDHTKYSTTIPAKTMISPVSLCNADGFVGFMNFYKYYGGFVRSN